MSKQCLKPVLKLKGKFFVLIHGNKFSDNER